MTREAFQRKKEELFEKYTDKIEEIKSEIRRFAVIDDEIEYIMEEINDTIVTLEHGASELEELVTELDNLNAKADSVEDE